MFKSTYVWLYFKYLKTEDVKAVFTKQQIDEEIISNGNCKDWPVRFYANFLNLHFYG